MLAAGCCGLPSRSNHGARNRYDQQGHGICSCGAMSGHESTTAARQRWHREHKAEVNLARGLCRCGNSFDGDNLCMVSACQWEQ